MSQLKKPSRSDEERRAARRERERRRRDKRARGLRPVVIWVPDRSHPRFAEECRRQSRLAAQTDAKEEWLEAWMAGHDSTGWTPNG
jgi:Protein  of unknown function (DUF3018)